MNFFKVFHGILIFFVILSSIFFFQRCSDSGHTSLHDTIYNNLENNSIYVSNLPEFKTFTNSTIPDYESENLSILSELKTNDLSGISQTKRNSKSDKVKKKHKIDVIKDVFDFETQCRLPKKLRDKIKKTKNAWPPEPIKKLVESFEDSLIYLRNSDSRYLLHSYIIKDKNGKIKDSGELFASPTARSNFKLVGKSSFVYNLDCSGLLDAALSVSGGFGFGKAEVEGGFGIRDKYSMAIIGGVYATPFFLALYPNSFDPKNRLKDSIRLEIMSAMLNLDLLTEEDDVLIFRKEYFLLEAAENGSDSFNGNADLNGKAGINLGVFKVGGDLDLENSISRSSSYELFSTYYDPQYGIDPRKGKITKQDLTQKYNKLYQELNSNDL